ncbi:hypothetical protein [Ramlibacter agri]|uniref:hypothetical protein n=1 Tax=Ramlibacter agri TaxID=2728837 RepID=UPI00146C62DB|nr:hypothetical protein [Ramlibacter agri]
MQGEAVAKRSPRGAKPARKKQQESKPMAPLERHSGEGSASALEMLQRMEDRRRLPARPAKDDPEA